jgi:hypothetical protein
MPLLNAGLLPEEICDCACHQGEPRTHEAPCCRACGSCGRVVGIDALALHAERCEQMTVDHADDLLRILKKWQASSHVRGETCPDDAAHGKLVPALLDGPKRVVLRCASCAHETPPCSIALLDLEQQLDLWERAAHEAAGRTENYDD